jgi:hypothetical protein
MYEFQLLVNHNYVLTTIISETQLLVNIIISETQLLVKHNY